MMALSTLDEFERFFERPTLYVGEKNLKLIIGFLAGYSHARGRQPHCEESDYFCLPARFNEWVLYHLGFDKCDYNMGFEKMILQRSESEETAIQLLYELIKKYHNRTPTIFAKYVKPKSDGCGKFLDELQAWYLVSYAQVPGFFCYSDPNMETPDHSFFKSINDLPQYARIEPDEIVVLDQTTFDRIRNDS